MTEQIFNDVATWEKATFPNGTALSMIEHLKEEVLELRTDVAHISPDRRLEFADCFILLMGAAHADGMNYTDICEAITDKMKVNKLRKWGNPDANGVVKHIQEF